MTPLLLATLALAAPFDEEDLPSDVIAQVRIDAPAQAVHDVLVDTRRMAELAPDCWRHWDIPGEGRAFEVVYRIKLFRRKLDARLDKVEAPGRLEWNHEGDTGFVTRFLLEEEEEEGGTTLTMTTFIAPPDWPVRRYWARKVHPAWVQCQQTLLDGVQSAALTDTAAD